ncbi:hypothetical protein ABXN37_22110 [Piscinibacter sakaiensis]|uniref:Uncharacterized protein n=1 Tax=Piscinibacter sakaiensis TaxID=1547922 RepID=A0A0K8P5P2_PISS1|nr:hypothetical protein [Piscinibacter sakaiensis]GAP37819.1 hypothetical protein ISF6_3764 [Piscinibacter sakaiensis]
MPLRASSVRHPLATATLALALAPALAQGQDCKLLALQPTPCQLVGADVVARHMGTPAASLRVEDNVKIMGRMPHLTSCIYQLPDGGEVRIGQIATSSPQAFDQRYRSQSEAEIAAGMGSGTRQAEQAIGRSVSGAEKATAQAGAAAIVRSMQYSTVDGLGEKARLMVSGNSPNVHLITLVKNQTFVVQVRAHQGTREKNAALARPIAAAIAARCR